MVNKKIYPLSPNIEFSHYAQYLPRKIGDSYYISFPLAAVEGIGMITAKSIYQEQKTNGRFINISDLKERTKINKANLENLAKTGTLHTY